MSRSPLPPQRVLVVEDDEGDAVLIERALMGSEFVPVRVACHRDALAFLRTTPCPAVLLDLSLPDSEGLEGIDRLRERFPALAIIVVTGWSDEQRALESLEHGAQDYLVKGAWSPDLLVRSLRYAIQRQQVQVENQRLVAQLEDQARHDPLTGLLNRRALWSELAREWSRAARDGSPLACVMLDLDFFKRINDLYGHAAGDEALRAVAAVIRAEARPMDLASRYGGEEFCVILPQASQEAARGWAERVRRRLVRTPIDTGGQRLSLTASFGVAERGEHTPRCEDLIERADTALQQAKKLGRNRVQAADDSNFSRDWSGPAHDAPFPLSATAADLMHPPEALLHPTAPLQQAAQHLLSARGGVLPVVDAQGKLLGLVGERELAGALRTAGDWFRPVVEVLQQNPPCCEPGTPLHKIWEFVQRTGVSEVVVVDEGHLQGLVSRFALLRWLYWSCGQPLDEEAAAGFLHKARTTASACPPFLHQPPSAAELSIL